MYKKRETVLIYYGPDDNIKSRSWRCDISDGKEVVRVPGSLIDCLRGTPGVTIGCHLSEVWWSNKHAFPHPVDQKPFVTNSQAYVITHFYKKPHKNGAVAHCVRYRHFHSDMVDLNDTDHGKVKVRTFPNLAERDFVLHPPRPRGPKMKSKNPGGGKGIKGIVRDYPAAKGALRRAIQSGAVTSGLAEKK